MLLNLHPVDIRHLALDQLDCLHLLNGLNVEIHHQVLVHIQEFRQHLICQFRSQNLQIACRAVGISHHEILPVTESEARRGNVVLGREAGFDQLVVVERKRIALLRVESLIHNLQALHTVQRVGRNAQHLEVVENIRFDTLQLWSCLPNIFSFNRKGDVLGAHQAVVALCQLIFQHLGILHTHIIKSISLWRDTDDSLKLCHVGLMVDKRKLEIDCAVKVVEEIAPVFKNGVFVLVLCQLVVNIIEADSLGIELVLHPANAVSPHLTIRD